MCGCNNKWRGPALHPRGHMVRPPDVFSVPIILKYFRKNHVKFSGHLENFYFWGIFYCKDNSVNRQKILFFALFNLNDRK